MTGRIFKNALKAISILSFIVIICAGSMIAQENVSASAASPQDELAAKIKAGAKNPPELMANLAEFLNKYPSDEQGSSFVASLGYYLRNEKNPETIRSLINQFTKNTAQLPAPLKANVYRYSAALLSNYKFYADAESLLKTAAGLLNEAQFVDFKKRQFDESQTPAAKRQRDLAMEETIKKYPKMEQAFREGAKAPQVFNLKRAKTEFTGLKINIYNLLGKSLWEQGKSVEAEAAYRNAYEIEPSKDSMLGIAKASEKNGNPAEALKYATTAALTGNLQPDEMDYFYSVYAKNNSGKPEGADKYLDAEYAKTYHNPVTGEKYKKSAKRSDRIVLAEFFTGAGCIPCIAFDYAFETVHKDYPAKDVALIVYHMHAPALDPLGNFSADSRVEYYDLIGAPGTFIDGVKFVEDEENKSGAATTNKNQKIYNSLVKQINTSLEALPEARLKMGIKRENQILKVKIDADKFQNVSGDVTLHIALVENEISYSGENGMRFHIMVVRALAGNADKKIFGFKVDAAKANKFEYSFDTSEIAARNLRYYDEYPAKERGGFKFKKNQMNSQNLSVVAFLQDNKTKKILQSSIVNR